MGKVKAVYIAEKGKSPVSQSSAELKAGKGIVGDRYYNETGTFSENLAGNPKREITFIAAEEIDQFNREQGECLDYGDARRNVVTEGVDLVTLIETEFRIGAVRFWGIERCEPCAHLAATVNAKVLPHLAHTGLRAEILESGFIHVGDPLENWKTFDK